MYLQKPIHTIQKIFSIALIACSFILRSSCQNLTQTPRQAGTSHDVLLLEKQSNEQSIKSAIVCLHPVRLSLRRVLRHQRQLILRPAISVLNVNEYLGFGFVRLPHTIGLCSSTVPCYLCSNFSSSPDEVSAIFNGPCSTSVTLSILHSHLTSRCCFNSGDNTIRSSFRLVSWRCGCLTFNIRKPQTPSLRPPPFVSRVAPCSLRIQ